MKKNKVKLLEADLKAVILNRLKQKGLINKRSIIMNELTIGKFARRVDLAILINDKLIAFEIKSEADSLRRLESQVNTYLNYFDKVVVVSDSKFFPRIMSLIPDDVGLWEIESGRVKVKRRGRLNAKIDNKRLIDFIDVVELRKLSSKLKVTHERKRRSLEEALLNSPSKDLRASAIATLVRKFKRRSEIFTNKTRNRSIFASDLKLLSRFYTQRARNQINQETSDRFWSNLENLTKELEDFASSIS
ncbi:sce7726 family protein [Halobacteriovorax sp. CON-3]|uniref:sce7726 family protein n=1 Tax=Halobacteriovorax sp. CON-3 TaxID=3157710 RepID=UPI00371AC3DF